MSLTMNKIVKTTVMLGSGFHMMDASTMPLTMNMIVKTIVILSSGFHDGC